MWWIHLKLGKLWIFDTFQEKKIHREFLDLQRFLSHCWDYMAISLVVSLVLSCNSIK
jgi:hypothetical protein